jgi:hypothetical protein
VPRLILYAFQRAVPLVSFQLTDASTFNDYSAQHLNALNSSTQSPSSSNQIVNDQHPITLLDGILLEAHPFPRTVLARVRRRFNAVRHLPLLADHDEWLLEGEGDGRAEDEATGVHAGNAIDPLCGSEAQRSRVRREVWEWRGSGRGQRGRGKDRRVFTHSNSP